MREPFHPKTYLLCRNRLWLWQDSTGRKQNCGQKGTGKDCATYSIDAVSDVSAGGTVRQTQKTM